MQEPIVDFPWRKVIIIWLYRDLSESGEGWADTLLQSIQAVVHSCGVGASTVTTKTKDICWNLAGPSATSLKYYN